jgi:hypothetical protein
MTILLLLRLLQQHVLIGTPAHENTSYIAGQISYSQYTCSTDIYSFITEGVEY